MKSRAGRLAFAIGLALAPRAWAGNTFEAVLVGSNEVPGPGISEGRFDAAVVVEGTKVSLTLTPKGIRGWMSAHIHKGVAGAAGKLVAEFPWESGDSSPRRYTASISQKVAADLAANPQKYYVHVHLPSFPAGGARGQLAAHVHAKTPAAFANLDTYVGDPYGAMPDAPQAPLPIPKNQSIDFPQARSRVLNRIPKASQRIVGAAPETKTYLDPDFPLDMSATSGLAVVFFAWGDCTVNGSYIHITGAGTCSLTAHQPGDSNYLAARIVDQWFPIAKADQTIDFPNFPNPYYGSYDPPLNASASSGLPIFFSAWGACSIAGPSSIRVLDSGECWVTAEQPGDRNFNAAPSVRRTFQIVLPPPPP